MVTRRTLTSIGSVLIALLIGLLLFMSPMSTRSKPMGLNEGIIMPRLNNATAKAQLGRAGWLLLHTMASRYPEHPTAYEKQTFKDFLVLFSKTYPCGDCASHFASMLEEYPVQTASRTSASNYLCMLHNKVNIRLSKPEFDCSKLEGLYDCGCNDDADGKPRLAIGTKEEGENSTLLDDITGEELIPG